MNTQSITSVISKVEQVMITPSTSKWVARAPQGHMRLTRLRADSRGTPAARGKQCKTFQKKGERRARGGRTKQKYRQHTNQLEKTKLGEP